MNPENEKVSISKIDYKLNRFLYFISLLICVFYITYTIQVFRNENSILISALLFIFWIFFSFLSNPITLIKFLERKKYLFLILFYFYYFIGGLISGLSVLDSIKLILGYFILLSPMIIFDFYTSNKKFKSIAILCFVGLGMYVFLSIKTLITLHINPMAARNLASGSLHNASLGSLAEIGIGGGYDLTYALCILLPFIIIVLKNESFNKIVFFSAICFIILSIYTIIKSDYGMAFLFTIIGVFFSLFIFSGKTKRDLLILIISIVVCGILLVLLINPIADLLIYISMFFENSFIGQRLNELGLGFKGYGFGSSTEYRFDLYLSSFMTFLENPFVGVGFLTQYNYYNNLQYIGGHSEWLDFLGVFGLIGSIPLFFVLFINYRETIKKYKNINYQSAIIIVYLLFIVIGSINLIFKFGVLLALMLIIPGFPILIKILNKKLE